MLVCEFTPICHIHFKDNNLILQRLKRLPWWLSGKESTCNAQATGKWVRSLGQEDPLEEGMAIHSSILAWRIPWIEEPGRATVHRVSKSQTRLKQLSTQALRNTGQTRRHFARLIAFLFYFLTSSASLFYKRNRHPDPDKMVPCLSIIGLSCSKQTKLGNIHISNQWLSTEYTQFYPS